MKSVSRIVLSFVLVLSHPLWAATIVVDETTCTLVDAITAANEDTAVGGCVAGSGPDTIQMTTDVTLTTVNNNEDGANGLPRIISYMTLDGGGFTIRRDAGSPPFRLLHLDWGVSATLKDLTLTNGLAEFKGGALLMNSGNWVLENVLVLGNRAVKGGGIHVGGNVTITNSTISNNVASQGGGILNYVSQLALIETTVSGNSANAGAGLWLQGAGPFGCGDSSTILTNSTVSGNPDGCGIAGECSLTLINSTISGNGFCGINVGNILPDTDYYSPVEALNSIIANNGNSNCFIYNDISLGNNFANDDSCGSGFADITPGVDFDTELVDNGGPTMTHALFPGSVAINAAGDCGLDTDQRGFPRNDGSCDSGSVEFQGDGDGVPASSQIGLILLLAILATLSWAVLRPKLRTR